MRELYFAGRAWPADRGYIMGILNVTPDSFSDGGCFSDTERALRHAEQMIADGADIIDVGGESTRPGYQGVDEEEEIRRVIPVIRAIRARFSVPVSVDTSKSRVAAMAMEAGADMINDVWGLKRDPEMAKVAARYDAGLCIMHNRKKPVYEDFLPDVLSDLRESLLAAAEAGVKESRIVVDPGVGFAKSYEQNLQILKHLELLAQTGFPTLLGTSRKSVIGLALQLPVEERLEGTVATTVMGRMKGALIFRVHDVKENRRALDMTDRVMGA
ncbi:MAG: dihydropteroate synthase [Lachnospiraceae bacterium]|nr:dihydropteroate synthase [Lachnospiraceae bacterium]